MASFHERVSGTQNYDAMVANDADIQAASSPCDLLTNNAIEHSVDYRSVGDNRKRAV